MSSQDRLKIFKRNMARSGLFFYNGLLNKMPYGMVCVFAHILISIGYVFIVKQKRIAQESLHIAFGNEKSDDEIKRISKNCFKNFGQGIVELIYFMGHPHLITEKVRIEGREHLDNALKKEKGVIAVSAHFGNFPLMLLYLAQLGYKMNAIIRQSRDEVVEKFFLEKRSSLGLTTVYTQPRTQCVNTSIKVLRENQVLFIPLDQNFGSAGGVFVDFFGQKAATATGPVVFTRRTAAVLLPMFIVREKDDQHKIIIEPPLELEDRGDDEETVLVNTARITSLIERYVRQYPQEWGWMHRRWKTKPPENQSVNHKELYEQKHV